MKSLSKALKSLNSKKERPEDPPSLKSKMADPPDNPEEEKPEAPNIDIEAEAKKAAVEEKAAEEKMESKAVEVEDVNNNNLVEAEEKDQQQKKKSKEFEDENNKGQKTKIQEKVKFDEPKDELKAVSSKAKTAKNTKDLIESINNAVKNVPSSAIMSHPSTSKVQKPMKKVRLERVLGLTVTNNAGLDCAPSSGLVAYPAGCTVVLYNPRKNRQSHITNVSRKTVTCLSFSDDGRFVVTGECGHLPNVRVWDVQEKTMVAEFAGHKFGINCVSFAPNNKYVVSVGTQHDMIVNVWDWRNNVKVASNKVSTKVKAISFAENGNYFVTAGNRHVKFWYLEYSRSKYKEPVPLMGRSAILGEQRNNYFCDVACGRGEMGDSTYAITKSGLLCEFNNRRLLDKWVELRTVSANCLSVGEDFIFIGCADGIVRCFSPHTLQFITTLPRTHYLGIDVSKGLNIGHMASHPANARYPDATAVTFDSVNFKVTVIYNDHSVYVWEVRDIKKVGKSHSFLFHAACIWGLDIYPSLPSEEDNTACLKPVLPSGSFVTCSSDDTIRIWNLSQNMSNDTCYKRNIYSEDLLKTLYVDPDLTFIRDAEIMNDSANNNENANTNGDNANSNQNSSNNNTQQDQRNGVRCIRISPDGRHLASGDRTGNVRVHDMQFMDELVKIEAHDAEVLCLEYSHVVNANSPQKAARRTLLSSASRDRLIHVFNASRDYSFVTTLDDHSSSITAVRFLKVRENGQMVSCGADKSVIFRDIAAPGNNVVEFIRGNHIVGKTTLYDMEIDPNCKHILTACQDRNVRVYSVHNAKHTRTFKGTSAEDGTLIKLALDRSGLYIATSCTDKSLSVFEYASGECVATMVGHSELVTGLRFTNDCRHLISVSGDGCIFIWRLPTDMTAAMVNKLHQNATRGPATTKAYIGGPSSKAEEKMADFPVQGQSPASMSTRDQQEANDYLFSVGKLPTWAKKQVEGQPPREQALSPSRNSADLPKGRWAQRVGGNGVDGNGGAITMKSHYDSDSVIPFPNNKDLQGGGEGPNSLDPRLQGRQSGARSSGNRPTTTDDSSLGSFNNNFNDGDADIDEYSSTHDDGGESTEPEGGLGYQKAQPTIYFNQTGDDLEKPSDFSVNAMDVEELRRSSRRNGGNDSASRSARPAGSSSGQRALRAKLSGGGGAATPSQESDFDDEEDASTPSAEASDRNLTSALSSAISTENVDRVGRHERFMRSNFESLTGSQTNLLAQTANQASFSNQYRESAVERNARTIARAQSFRDTEQNKRREELQRRIEETRRKLQNIGYRSMKGSQSISDLSSVKPDQQYLQSGLRGAGVSGKVDASERPHSTEPSSMVLNNTTSPTSGTGSKTSPGQKTQSGDSTDLRRAVSLSDINRPNVARRILPSPPTNVSGRKSRNEDQTSPKNNQSNSSDMRRRQSRDNLNQNQSSSSPPEATGNLPSYMRSTSASSKKFDAVKSSPQSSRLRKNSLTTQSTQDLRSGNRRSVIRDDDDSSSEENNGSPSKRSGQDRRVRALGGGEDHHQMSRSERDLSKVTKVRVRTSTTTPITLEQRRPSGNKLMTSSTSSSSSKSSPQKAKMKTTTMIVSGGNNDDDVKVNQQPLTREAIDSACRSAAGAADDLVRLYKRVAASASNLDDRETSEMLHKISNAAAIASHTLRPIVPAGQQQSATASTSSSRARQQDFTKTLIKLSENMDDPNRRRSSAISESELSEHFVEVSGKGSSWL